MTQNLTPTTDTGFDDWMKRVDAACWKLSGLSAHDLPDCCYGDWHEDGLTPVQAARRAIRSAKSEGEL